MGLINPPTQPLIVYQNAVQVSHTGDLVETTLASITIPGGLIGANGQVEIIPLWSCTNNANSKTFRIKFGSSLIYSIPLPNLQSQQLYLRLANRNAENSQVVFGAGSGFQSTVNPFSIYGVDTSVDQDILITGQLANATDTVALQSYIVKVFPQE